MCLALLPRSRWKRKRCVAWKVVVRRPTARDEFRSPFFYVAAHVLGQESVSCRRMKGLFGYELSSGKVDYGMHVYTSRKAAFAKASRDPACRVVLRCGVSPNDHVADGMNKEAVYMKIKPLCVEGD